MKQILVITRIDSRESNDEFVEIFEDQDIQTPIIGENSREDLRLSIWNGLFHYYKKNRQIAESIVNLIEPNAGEVLIVFHYTIDSEGLSNAFNRLRGDKNWQIASYSSGDKNYNEIVKAFREVRTNPSKADSIYKLFSPDYVLKAKIDLLRSCIIPQNIPSECDLNRLLSDYSASITNFKLKVKEIIESLPAESGGQNNCEELRWTNKEYQRALAELRTSLMES